MSRALCELSAAEQRVFERALGGYCDDLMCFFRIESDAWMAARHGYGGAVPAAFRITLLFAVLAELGVTCDDVAKALQTMHPIFMPDGHAVIRMLRRRKNPSVYFPARTRLQSGTWPRPPPRPWPRTAARRRARTARTKSTP